MMKNVFLSAALMLLSISAFAQTAEENLFSGPEDFDTYPREVYCEIESYTKRILTNKVAVKVDFGQEADFRYKDSRLVDENGEDIIFNSIVDAANYMAKRGWIFNLRPAAIIRKFGLKNPIYEPTAAYGHFGREPYTKVLELTRGGKTVKEEVQFFGWEKLDSVDLIRTEFGL